MSSTLSTTGWRRSATTRRGVVGRGARDRPRRLQRLRDEAGDVAGRFFAESWIDAPVRRTSAPAFCATSVPGVHPYVLMNFTGDRRSILTLAHEPGTVCTARSRRRSGCSTPRPRLRWETASVFGEALTFKRLLAFEEDPQAAQSARRADRGLDRDGVPADLHEPLRGRRPHERRERASCRPTVSRRSGSRRRGACSTTRRPRRVRDVVELHPHFLSTPGYVYAYAHGFLFALSIFRKYELDGDAMVGPYLELLGPAGRSLPRSSPRSSARPRRSRPLGQRDRRARSGARRGGGARSRDRPRQPRRRAR